MSNPAPVHKALQGATLGSHFETISAKEDTQKLRLFGKSSRLSLWMGMGLQYGLSGNPATGGVDKIPNVAVFNGKPPLWRHRGRRFGKQAGPKP